MFLLNAAYGYDILAVYCIDIIFILLYNLCILYCISALAFACEALPASAVGDAIQILVVILIIIYSY